MNQQNTFSGRKSSQNAYELDCFVKFMQENGIRRYMEIGARHGDTFHYIMSNLPKSAFGVAVDLPGGLWGTVKSQAPLLAAIDDLYSNGFCVKAIIGDSQDKDTVEHIKQTFDSFDMILIDGDHTLDGVTKDWENYRGMAKYIAFHDIVGTGEFEKPSQRRVEVPILWEKIKKSYDTVEFIDKGSKMGIGVVKCLL